METIKVNTKEQLDYLYKNWALTKVGLAESSINDFIEWLKEECNFIVKEVYIIKGSFMNEQYELTGDNAYHDDLTIVSVIPTDDKMMHGSIVVKRFAIDAKWFYDIVENNKRRENN